ncbi:MAG: hypothetical protein ACRDKI_08355 [Solirubrobacterales bacterium]
MKKTLMTLGAVLAAFGLLTGSAVAHGGHHGQHGKGRAQIWRAQLVPTPVAAPSAAAKASGATGETGETGATGPAGKAQFVQNKRRYNFMAHVRGVTPGAVYTVAIYQDTDGQGCSSTSNTPLSPPVIDPVTATPSGHLHVFAKGKTSEFSLDKAKSYYVKVTDAGGASVVCGALVRKTRGHGCHGKHGANGEAGGGEKAKGRGHGEGHGEGHGHR